MNQQLLLPDLRQWLRDDHLALYVSDVVEALDLSGIYNDLIFGINAAGEMVGRYALDGQDPFFAGHGFLLRLGLDR